MAWRRMLALVTVFAVGGMLGASGWHLYENTAGLAATDSQVEVLAGFPVVPREQPARGPIAGPPPIPRELTVAVFNLGQRDVVVLQARPVGWPLTADLELAPVAAWSGRTCRSRSRRTARSRRDRNLTLSYVRTVATVT
jgi:hypothetical protein